MKITPHDIAEIKNLGNFGLGLMVNGLKSFTTAEVAFDLGKTEYNVFPIIKPIGMALILSHMEKKYNSESTIFIIDNETKEGKEQLSDALKYFGKMKDGSNMSLLVWGGGHWRTVYCERIDNKSHVAVIDSLGIGIQDNPVEAMVNSDSLLRENVILYRSVNRIQVDRYNCGIIALRMAHKLAKEKNFFGKLKHGDLILTKNEASNHFINSKQVESGFKEKTDHYFVLPPEYFALAQRTTHLKHYKAEFGDRKGIKAFSKISKSTVKTLSIDDLFNKKQRKESLSPVELGGEPEITNYNVLYFCNKYINSAILSVAKAFSMENMPNSKIISTLKNMTEKHILDNDVARNRLFTIKPESTMDSIISNGDLFVNVNISGLESSDVKTMKMEDRQHYATLVEEEKLEQRITNKKHRVEITKVAFGYHDQSRFHATSEQKIITNVQQEKIKNLATEIVEQIDDYKMRIEEEKKSTFWISDSSIKLWEDKIAVLTEAHRLLIDTTGQIDPGLLKDAEYKHSGWNNGVVTKELVERVKNLKGIPLNWKEFRPEIRFKT